MTIPKRRRRKPSIFDEDRNDDDDALLDESNNSANTTPTHDGSKKATFSVDEHEDDDNEADAAGASSKPTLKRMGTLGAMSLGNFGKALGKGVGQGLGKGLGNITSGFSKLTAMARRSSDVELASYSPQVDKMRKRIEQAFQDNDVAAAKHVLDQEKASVSVAAFDFAVRESDLARFQFLLDVGADVNERNASQWSALDCTLNQYKRHTSQVNFELVRLGARFSETHRCLERMASFVKTVDMLPDTVQMLLQDVVQGSDFPVTTALKAAAFAKTTADDNPVHVEEYDEVASFFSSLAINLLNDIENDHVAFVVLDGVDLGDNSPLSVSIDSQNKEFLGNARVTRLMSTLWSRTEHLRKSATPGGEEGAGLNKLVKLLLTHPSQFMRLPLGKFMLESISFLMFLGLFTWVCFQRVTFDSPIEPTEAVLWFCVVGFCLTEAQDVWENGFVNYYDDTWNIVDSAIYGCFVVLIMVRMTTAHHEHGLGDNAMPLQAIIYRLVMAVLSVMMFTRSSYLLIINPTVGPLLRMVGKMFVDIKNFILLLLIFLVGYSLGLYFFCGDSIEAYESIPQAFFSLFDAICGNVDFSPFQDLDTTRYVIAIFLYGSYVILLTIMLVNLLIAMMSSTYESVQESSVLEFTFLRAEVIYRNDRSDNCLPPPWNQFVYGLSLVQWTYTKLRNCCRGTKRVVTRDTNRDRIQDFMISKKTSSNDETVILDLSPQDVQLQYDAMMRHASWHCGFCHTFNEACSRDDLRRDIHAWIRKNERMKSEEEFKEGHDVQLIEDYVLCRHCRRVQKKVDDTELAREKIGFWVFMMLLFVPLLLLLFVPIGLLILKNMLFQILDYRNIKWQEQQERDRMERAAVQQQLSRRRKNTLERDQVGHGRRDMSSWVEEHIPEEPVSLDDINELMNEMGQAVRKLKKITTLIHKKQKTG